MASSVPSAIARTRAAHSTSSSRVRGNRRPLGTPPREWLARPTRWSKVAMLRGVPIWQTNSTGPMSMPSSREAVATRALSSPARRRVSTRWRRSLDSEPWWADTESSPRRSASWWARRSARRRLLTKTMVVRCSPTRTAMRSSTSPICAADATASSSPWGSSRARSRRRRWPVSTTAHGCGEPAPVSSPAHSEMGRWVAERPMRWGRVAATCSRRSRDSARWQPRLSRAKAWISSTMTVSVLRSSSRPRAAVSRR